MHRIGIGRLAIALGLGIVAMPAVADGGTKASTVKRPLRSQRRTADVAPSNPTSGNASFYSHHLAGNRTASGERYDPAALTAAHRTLPLGTHLKVVNPQNDRSVVVTVNDRGPHHGNRMLDVSSAAADQLGMRKSGVTRVHTEVVHHDADHRPDGPVTPSSPSDDGASH
jgi:rare lipoprotein A (peptidoglycan hydrolase)